MQRSRGRKGRWAFKGRKRKEKKFYAERRIACFQEEDTGAQAGS
jgi:hypothetical protein